MNAPDPKANTTTEAYLAYKAGYLEESELKPKLYKPDWHFDGWLAYWAGLVNTYPTKENGEPEMLCDEEALVAYLSGVTNTYPEEIKDPYDVRIVGYLRHLASTRWPEPDYPVNNEEFYLSTMEPTHTSNPVPNSDIELDTAEGKIISVEAYGDTYQQTYSGKNIIDFTTISYSGSNNGSGIRDGATFTVTGASDGNWGGVQFNQSNLQLKTDTTYTFSATVVSTTNTNGSMVYVNSGMSNTGSQIYGNYATAGERTVVTFTTPSLITNSASIRLYPAIVDGRAVFTDIMVEESATATSYEPYVGGIPAPNPDYPQTVNVVTGMQNVWVHGNNLFDMATASANKILAWTTSNEVSNTGSVTSDYIGVVGGYTINANYIFAIFFYDSTKGLIGHFNGSKEVVNTTGGGYFDTVVIPDGYNIAYCRLVFRASQGDNPSTLTNKDIMVNKGVSLLPYEPYQSQSYTVDLGSIELCKIGDYQDYIYKSGDDWYLHKEIGKVVYDGSENWSFGTASALRVIVDLETNMEPYTTNALCSHLAYGNTGSVSEDNVFNIGGSKVFAKATAITTSADSWKTWLATHNVSLYYQLTTSTDTEITDSTLIGQLDALAGADTYNEKTFIKVTATDPNLPVLLKVEAYKY